MYLALNKGVILMSCVFCYRVLGDDSQFTNFYKLSLLSNEYIVSVNGVTGGLNLGIQFINFTTNLGRSLSEFMLLHVSGHPCICAHACGRAGMHARIYVHYTAC